MLHFHKILDFKLKLSLTGNLRTVKWYRGGEAFTGNMIYFCFTLKKTSIKQTKFRFSLKWMKKKLCYISNQFFDVSMQNKKEVILKLF